MPKILFLKCTSGENIATSGHTGECVRKLETALDENEDNGGGGSSDDGRMKCVEGNRWSQCNRNSVTR